MKTEITHIKFQAKKPFVKYFKDKREIRVKMDNNVHVYNPDDKHFIATKVEVRLENNSKEVYASNKVPAYVSLVP
jgi:UDP-N-acetylmuramyl tripeptide synthase